MEKAFGSYPISAGKSGSGEFEAIKQLPGMARAASFAPPSATETFQSDRVGLLPHLFFFNRTPGPATVLSDELDAGATPLRASSAGEGTTEPLETEDFSGDVWAGIIASRKSSSSTNSLA